MLIRFIFLVLIIALISWGWVNLNPENFSKEKIEETIKKEKTINTVQQGREQRRLEAEKVMEQF